MITFQCFFLILLFAPPTYADLDPEADKPYRLQVVLHIADNRFLTPLFQDQVRGELGDRLQLALGSMAKVEVLRQHLLLPEIEAKGLDTVLDSWTQVLSLKTHFVFVDFAQGVYSLRARQHDGTTGLASPVVRQIQTSDRAQVGQMAARLVEQDFGIVGTVVKDADQDYLVLKAGQLAGNWDRAVKPGDIFAVSRITKEGDKVRGSRVPWTLVEVLETPRAGKCRFKLWHRFAEDDLRPLPGVLGYRCLKIATTPGPLKLRLIDDEHFRPLDGMQVHVLRPGSNKVAELTTNRDGLTTTRASFPQMVLVRILSGTTVRTQLPIEMVGNRTVVCRLKIQPGAEAQAPLEFRRDLWLRRILDSLRLSSERVVGLNKELNTSLEAALASARGGLKTMTEDLEVFDLERTQIQRQVEEKKAKINLREGEQALAALRSKKQDLEKFITRIEGVLKDAQNAEALGLTKLIERARLLESEADFGQAIGLYEKVLAASPNQAKVKDHLDKLKTAWMPKNPKHAEARQFLIKTWPAVEVTELQKHLAKAKQALEVCREAQDRLTPLRMVRANVAHGAALAKHLETLRDQDNEDNRNQAKAIVQAAEGLRQLHAEATALVGKNKKDG